MGKRAVAVVKTGKVNTPEEWKFRAEKIFMSLKCSVKIAKIIVGLQVQSDTI